jgi:hypothetical protein
MGKGLQTALKTEFKDLTARLPMDCEFGNDKGSRDSLQVPEIETVQATGI